MTSTPPNKEQPVIPKDLQLKVGTKEEAVWARIKASTEENTEENNVQNLINEQVIALADRKIKEEQAKK